MIKIKHGKNGFILSVDGLHIRKDVNLGYGVIALTSPFGATEFNTVKDLKEFWGKYKEIIVNAAIKMPYTWANSGYVRDFGHTDIKQTDCLYSAKCFLSIKYGIDYKGSQLTDAEIDYWQELKQREAKNIKNLLNFR